MEPVVGFEPATDGFQERFKAFPKFVVDRQIATVLEALPRSAAEMKTDYSVNIMWSREDSAYLALASELPGCVADGQTPEEALDNLRSVISEWIEVAKEEGRQIPRPLTVEDLEDSAKVISKHLRDHLAKKFSDLEGELSRLLGPPNCSFSTTGRTLQKAIAQTRN